MIMFGSCDDGIVGGGGGGVFGSAGTQSHCSDIFRYSKRTRRWVWVVGGRILGVLLVVRKTKLHLTD